MSRRVRRSRDIAHREVEGQTVIVLPRTNEILVLNETGACIWELSDGGRTEAEVVEGLRARFDIDRETAARDVAALYDQLIEAGVAETAE
ncbi:MAG TPA: PqqD family protein [Chloroflexota bacterium]|nr:PqqD family protein [Chloroflexota bacterium]